jgi:hypothetical protein
LSLAFKRNNLLLFCRTVRGSGKAAHQVEKPNEERVQVLGLFLACALAVASGSLSSYQQADKAGGWIRAGRRHRYSHRLVGQQLSERLGVAVTVENRQRQFQHRHRLRGEITRWYTLLVAERQWPSPPACRAPAFRSVTDFIYRQIVA